MKQTQSPCRISKLLVSHNHRGTSNLIFQGIHGLPFQTWPLAWPDGTPNEDIEPATNTAFQGFCTHTSVLFLTWHRPYLALFEVRPLMPP